MLSGGKERLAENIFPLDGTRLWVPGNTSSPSIRASAHLLCHVPKPSSGNRTSQHHWGDKEAPTQQARAGRNGHCHAAGHAQGGDLLTRALATETPPRLHQGGNASLLHEQSTSLPCRHGRQLGHTPGGQGNAFSRQAFWERLSLPRTSHALIWDWPRATFLA